MARWQKLFRCVGKALCVEGIQALVAEIPLGGFLFGVAEGAWINWHEDEQDEALRIALNEAAAIPAAEAQAEADAVAGELTAGQPDFVRQKVAGYLAQLPAHIHRSIQLQGDPTGTMVPATVRLHEPADLLAFLPPSLPQFRPGDALPGRDPWWPAAARCRRFWRSLARAERSLRQNCDGREILPRRRGPRTPAASRSGIVAPSHSSRRGAIERSESESRHAVDRV